MKKYKASTPRFSQLQTHAIEASHRASKVLMRYFGKKLHVFEKAGAGLVTHADIEAQNQAVRYLRKADSQFGFLTEEDKPERQGSPGRWIIDPLDGTTNYIHGFPMFCVSIAAEWEGELVVGVIYHPVLQDTYTAIRGKGAYLNRKRIQVSRTRNLRNALLTTGFTYRKDKWLGAEMAAFEKLSGITRAIRRPGSAALDLAYTARGVFDGFWERRLSPWDVAAGALIVTEAGGKISDFKGDSFQIDSGELLASNSQLHSALLSEIAEKTTDIH